MLELLFLLLPVAAFYGYVMGMRYAKKSSESKEFSHIHNLVRGINYFLNRETDKASDELIKYLDTQGDHSFEESIALGNIIRERGDLDRAIKFHQGLMTKEGLKPTERSYALLELAKDFQRAGLLSKAEEILYELISYNSQKVAAALLLIDIYEQEKDWVKALKIIDTYRRFIADKIKFKEAHFYCELANDEFIHKDYSKSIDLFKKALNTNDKCFRAYFSIAKIYIEQQKFTLALEFIQKANDADVTMQGLLVKHLKKCFADPNSSDLIDILNKWLETSTSIEVVLALAEIYYRKQGKEVAEDFLMRILKVNPNIALFAQLLNYRLADLDSKGQERLAVLKSLIDMYQVKTPRFICCKCGFKSSILFWQCPSCHHWESMKPTEHKYLD